MRANHQISFHNYLFRINYGTDRFLTITKIISTGWLLCTMYLTILTQVNFLTILRFFTCCALVASITTYSCLAFNSPIRRFLFTRFFFIIHSNIQLKLMLCTIFFGRSREIFQGFSSHEFWHARVKNKGMNTDK